MAISGGEKIFSKRERFGNDGSDSLADAESDESEGTVDNGTVVVEGESEDDCCGNPSVDGVLRR